MIQWSECGREGMAPEVLLVSPPPIGTLSEDLADMFAGAHEIAPHLAGYYREIAGAYDCGFVDGSFLDPDPADGLHLTVEGQRQLGERIAEAIQNILG
jgi:lysophospholipase L1-like esterase